MRGSWNTPNVSSVSRREFIAGVAGVVSGGVVLTCTASETKTTTAPARFWRTDSAGTVVCELCPHGCRLPDGATGLCRVRTNRGGQLVTLGYANPCAVHVDPIEKKPFYHVLPGAKSFSIAVAGCNFRCLNCQNYTISQVSPLQTQNDYLPPAKVVEKARATGCTTVAYTYSEPSVWFEYMYDTAKCAREAGLKNLWVTNGYLNEKPIAELAAVMDAANIDLKGFDEHIHMRLNGGKLDKVMRGLVTAQKHGIWVEVTNLIVPEWTDNLDSIRRMCDWLVKTMGPDTPLHFSRFHPTYRLAHLPPTPRGTLESAKRIATEAGMRYVYIGNVGDADTNTYCPRCRRAVVRRRGYWVTEIALINGACRECGEKIAGIWAL